MKVLMVCLGNICRSPIAEGILQHLSDSQGLGWQVDSAGTSGWHQGEAPDGRSQQVAAKYGIDISQQKSRKFTVADFDQFDLIFAMDTSNFNDILKLARNPEDRSKVSMILEQTNLGMNRSVPDPYYEGGFEGVYAMLFEACNAIVEEYQLKAQQH